MSQGTLMPFRPNYRFERFERERLKKAKKEEKLRRQQERTPPPEEDKPSAADEAIRPD
jgi:hypothetical protein